MPSSRRKRTATVLPAITIHYAPTDIHRLTEGAGIGIRELERRLKSRGVDVAYQTLSAWSRGTNSPRLDVWIATSQALVAEFGRV